MIRAAAMAIALLAAAAPASAGLDDLTWVEPPEAAADAAFQDADGNARTIADFKGRVVLLNLWASWCAPCRAEMPSLDSLAARLRGPHFAVVAVSEDRSVDDARAFLADMGLGNLDLYMDPGLRLAARMRAAGLPATYIIDHEGRVVARLLGAADWASDEAVALIEPLVVAALDAAIESASRSCSCGGPKAQRIARYGTVAPPPED